MRLLLLLILLLPIFAFAEEVKIFVDYRGSIKADKINIDSAAQRAWMTNQVKSNSAWFADSKYMGRLNLHSGAVAKSALPVVLEHQVTKKAVLQSMFSKVSQYAKNPLVGRAGWLGLGASFAIPYIIDEFILDEDKGAWVSVQKYHFVLVESGYNSGLWGTLTTGFNSVDKLQEACAAKSTACKVLSTHETPTDVIKNYCNGRSWEHTYYGPSGPVKVVAVSDGSISTNKCYSPQYKTIDPGSGFLALARINETRVMTYDDFERLTLPAADADPSPWVNYSRPSQNEAPPSFSYVGVTAQSGATANTDPYTDPFDGKAKETKITINTDGKTVTLDHTLRPDLQGQTDVAPVPTPIPDNDKETSPETKPETNPASTPVQCDKYPDTLGCEKMGDGSEAESIFSDIKIPEITNPSEFKLDNFLPSTGTCPAPKTITLSMGTIVQSYEKHCEAAEMLRPFIIIISSLVGLYLIIRSKD
ncbi:hypothetical protein LVJ82_01405 [Vitreoscilla massiliensis]|uniref:TspB protein n=1 Tax=Vitreoscilla massiliensis TaxID=1689272 RepID=A0ABY4E2C0_9NEIS|nr:IgG-binding virulence factor TspB family protein [Vitreoscilla massiliensis]UOO89672.1 hypothetical protein LVJ82_01405 [Vitreoscilla massiliensis]